MRVVGRTEPPRDSWSLYGSWTESGLRSALAGKLVDVMEVGDEE